MKSRTMAESVFTGFMGQLFLLVSGVLIARILGPDDRGNFAMLVVLGTVVVQLLLVGLPQALTYFIAKVHVESASLLRLVRKACALQCGLSLVVFSIVIAAYLGGREPDFRLAAWLSLFALPGAVLSAYGLAGLQGLGHFRLFNVMRAMNAFSWAILAIILYVAGAEGLPLIVGIWSVLQLVVGIATWVLLLARGRGRPCSGSESITLGRLSSFGFRGMIGYRGPLETFRLDQLILGLMFAPAVLGVYVVAQSFTNLPRLVAQSMGYVIFPSLSRSGSGSSRSTLRDVMIYLLASNLVLIPVVTVLLWLMPMVIGFLFGTAFQDSVPIARILLLGAVLAATRRIVAETFRGYGRPQTSTQFELLSYPMLAAAGFWLVPGHGAYGMALAVLITNAGTLLLALAALARLMSDTARLEKVEKTA